jgi:hypothetical protein
MMFFPSAGFADARNIACAELTIALSLCERAGKTNPES